MSSRKKFKMVASNVEVAAGEAARAGQFHLQNARTHNPSTKGAYR